jgi:hypothetical protein
LQPVAVRQKIMHKQARDVWESVRLVAIGLVLSVVIFAVPDVGYTEHKSIFAVAVQSAWGHPCDWPSAWCSVKIILMALAALAFVNAVLGLLLDSEYKGASMAVFTSAIFPLLLGFFGLYELIKAIF